MIKALIFDCFGVIRIDPTFLAYRALGGDDEADHDFIVGTMLASDRGQIPSATPVFAERLGITEAKWETANRQASPFDEDVLDYIASIRKFYKTAMLTNIGEGDLAKWFKPHVLESYFEVAVASGDVGYAKPEAQAYHITAERLGVRADECVMIDDREVNVRGAQNAGMHGIVYVSLDQLKDDLIGVLAAENDR